MDCRERLPVEPTDSAGAGAPTLRDLVAVSKRVHAAYQKRPKLPAAVRRAQFENLLRIERTLHGLCANATPEPDCVRRARQYIAAHLIEQFTAEKVAEHVSLCPQQFRKRFKQATGKTFGQYLTMCRVEHAKELLRDPGRKVLKVCFDSGFLSLSPFYRAFRKHAGQSATEYRRKYR